MKNTRLSHLIQIIITAVIILIMGCSATPKENEEKKEVETEVEQNEEVISTETQEEVWKQTKIKNTYSGYRLFLDKYPNDTEALKAIFKTTEFKDKYGSFLKFFDNLKYYEDAYDSYFTYFSKSSTLMNNDVVNYPYTENHFNEYGHKKLCSEAEIMKFPALGSQGVMIDIYDKGISWAHQSVGAGASVMVSLEWVFEDGNLRVSSSSIEISHYSEGEEAIVDLGDTSDCKPKFKIEGVNDAKGYYENSALNASWTIHFDENNFVAFYTKDGKDSDILIVDKINKISDCEYYIWMEGVEGEFAQRWKLRYNADKKYYDLIHLTYDKELETWIDVDFEGSSDNGPFS